MVNINLYKLVNACIDHGPGWAHPGSRKLGRKLSSLTGSWIWDIVGLRKKKNALTRSSMRAAQGPWLREVLSQHALGTGNHGPGSSLQSTSFRTNPRSQQARKPRAQASSQRPQAPRSWNQGTSAQAQGPGHKQQGQMNFLDDVRKRLFGGVRSVFC